jgi:hypothetical protein
MKTVRLPTLRVPTLDTLRSVVLHVAGLGSISYGAWLAHPVAGFLVGGASLLVLDWLARPDAAGPR